jgi:hypothetical protein
MIATPDPSQLESWELLLLRATHEMSLTKPQYDLIQKRYETLEGALQAATDPVLLDAHIFVQGSIGLRTTIKPARGATDEMATIDADAVVWLPNAADATGIEVLKALEERVSAATRVEEPVSQLRRGIRITYADEKPGFHIDVTPARCTTENSSTHGVGPLVVADRHAGWKPSSPKSYMQWLANTADLRIALRGVKDLEGHRILIKEASQEPIPDYEDYVDGNPLRAAVKLLKRHRDVWAITNKRVSNRPISAVITTLTAQAYRSLVAAGRVQTLRPIEVILEVVRLMPTFIRKGPSGYEVQNPMDSGENFAEKWNRSGQEGLAYVAAFQQWHTAAVRDVALGLEDFGTESAFREAVTERFDLPESTVRDVLRELPGNWTLPGRKPGTTRNALSLASLSGMHAAGSGSQSSVKTTDRLG